MKCIRIIFIAAILFCSPLFSVFAADLAQLNLYVFKQGTPASGMTVEIGRIFPQQTNRQGALEQMLPAGRHLLRLKDNGEQMISLDLLLQESEHLLLIITIPEGRGYPVVAIESSHGDEAGQASKRPQTGGETLPPGFVQGHVHDVADGGPIVGARIFVSGVAMESTTDEAGFFRLEVPPGNYSLSAIHSDFNTQTIDHLRVKSQEEIDLEMELTPSGVELADYMVLAPYIEGSVASIMEQQKSSEAVTEVIGAEQMSKSGDSDAAGALKRVTGLTVEQGKFVLVRGLPPRYTKTMWNGSELPSPDPNGRLVPLDLFPTNVLKAVQVRKSYSPDNPGSFGGGLVELETKGLPKDNFFDVAFGVEYNSETTLQTGLTYDGGSKDWLGYDDGSRELPGKVEQAADSGRQLGPISITNPDGFSDDELEAMGESFTNIYDVDEETLPPNFRVEAAGGMSFEQGWGEIGFQGSYLYDYEWQNKTALERTFSLNGRKLQVADDYEEFESDVEVSNGGLFTIGGEIGEEHAFASNTFYIRKTNDVTRMREGRRSENDQDVREVVLGYAERELLSQQFTGNHALPALKDATLSWRYMYAETEKDAPDRRFYRYILLEQPVFDGSSLEQPVFDGSSLERRYANLEETRDSYGFDLSKTFNMADDLTLTLKTGYDYSERERESDVKRYTMKWRRGSVSSEIANLPSLEQIFAPENIDRNGFVIDDLTGANDDSEGVQEVEAAYLMADVNLYDLVRLVGGVRQEDSNIYVKTFQSSGDGEQSVESSIDTDHLLPALSGVLSINDEMQLRAGYGRSVSRPDFREISTAQFIDPESGDTYVGNPNLQEAEFESVDLRWEWYPSATEYLSLGIFAKDIKNAIETVKIPGFNAPQTFQNADQADVRGIELGFRKSLNFIAPKLENFYVTGNTTLIDSNVKLAENSLFSNTNNERELQGQAPYVMNFSLGYSDDASDVTLLFNQVGERISEVGIQGQPDIMQQPTPQLDLIAQHKFSQDYKLKFSFKNILNPDVEYKQGSEIQKSYKRGFDVSFKLSKSF